VPVKVVSERLGHAHIAHTIQTYQHLLPGMSADAAARFERLAEPLPTDDPDTEDVMGITGGTPPDPRDPSQRARPRSLTWAYTLKLVAGVGFEPTTFGL
jgi:hypothetical protein